MQSDHTDHDQCEDRGIQCGGGSSALVSCLGPHCAHSFRSIDISEAQTVPGFVCFISAEDVPGSNKTGILNDETVFAKDEVGLGFF